MPRSGGWMSCLVPSILLEYLRRLRSSFDTLRPTNTANHTKVQVFIHQDLSSSSHVFVRQDLNTCSRSTHTVPLFRQMWQTSDNPEEVWSVVDRRCFGNLEYASDGLAFGYRHGRTVLQFTYETICGRLVVQSQERRQQHE
ncbi:hypothetical protein JTE90_026744 [Oedothorax gibbosus]|uniref:Uncharacterized protein n=1 Tax=Oedothorax gibbosus TaxID=931172 RepID=A0AAV6U5H6_9ARAC|nr:hypothetical protein JTE90_026744 [Oedothorax gibbosus]